jgi:hypothetical protein
MKEEINLEDIIQRERNGYVSDVFNLEEVLNLMKQACLETLELAAKNVEFTSVNEYENIPDNVDVINTEEDYCFIDKQSILNLKDKIK